MKAPVGGNDRQKNPDLKKLSPGFHIGRLYGIVDLGTHLNTMFNTYSRKVVFLFEFPELVQFYYKEDDKAKPAMISKRFTLSMASKSNLRPFVAGMTGQALTDDQAAEFDLQTLLGKWYTLSIIHNPSKDGTKIYEDVNIASPYNQALVIQGVNYQPFNQDLFFSIDDNGFQSQNYTNLYKYMRDILKKSNEGIAWVEKGGTFSDPQPQDNQSGQQSRTAQGSNVVPPAQPNLPQAPAAPIQQNIAKVIMLVTDFTYEQYLANNWTDEMLVNNGKAKWNTPAQPQQPSAPAAPQNNQPPQAPVAPQAPQQPQTVAAPPVSQPSTVPSPVTQGGPQHTIPQQQNNPAGLGDHPDDGLPF